MRRINKSEGAPIIIRRNAREEFHLTMAQEKGRKYVDLRACIRDPEKGQASPTGNGITVNLKLWPLFMAAVSNSETWTDPLPFWSQQKTRDFTRGRLIFPEEALRKNPQEQIFLEAKNFQGIPFISLKTLAPITRGRQLSLVTLGPLLWSQFLWGLRKMEEALIELGWLAKEPGGNNAGLSLPEIRRELPPRLVGRDD